MEQGSSSAVALAESERRPHVLDDIGRWRGTLYPLVREYVNGRLQRREIVNASARSLLVTLRNFAGTYGNRPVANMSRADIQWYQAKIAHLSVGTRRNRISVTRTFVRWLQQEGKLKNDPFIGVQLPKPPRRVPRALTRDEVDRLWAVLPDARARVICGLMLGMGMRRVEVLRLLVSDWDRRKQTMRIVGKGGHERILPVPEHVSPLLEAYVSTATEGPIILRSTGYGAGGISHDQLGALMRAWMEEAGVKHGARDGKGCHSLRHTLASEVADIEPDLRITQQLLGHVSLASTQIYLRGASPERLRVAIDAAGGAHRSSSVMEPAEVADRLLRVCRRAELVGHQEDVQQLLRNVAGALDRAERS